MSYPNLIGIVGFINSGKGTVGDIIQNEFGYAKDSFAKPVKDAVSSIFGWDRKLLEGDTAESREWRERPDQFWSDKFGYEITPRLCLQLLGTEACRNVFHDDIWVASLIERSRNRKTVITDVRFRNEIEMIRQNNGIIIRVVRGNDPIWYNVASLANRGMKFALETMESTGIHTSEWSWCGCDFDYEVRNDGTIDDLRNETKNIFENMRNI